MSILTPNGARQVYLYVNYNSTELPTFIVKVVRSTGEVPRVHPLFRLLNTYRIAPIETLKLNMTDQ